MSIAERVLAAADQWVWVPPDAEHIVTDEYEVTHLPDRTSVQWSRTRRPLPDVVDEIHELAVAGGRPMLRWWTRESTQPKNTGEILAGLGFELAEELEVLALDLRSGSPVDRLAAPDEVRVVPVDDEAGFRLAGRLGAEVFGWWEPTDAQIAEWVGFVEEGRRTGRWTERQFLAYLDGQPVGQAGCRVAGDIVRLYGAGVLPEARGRGVYRALIAARCRLAIEQGVSLALAKARIGTSGPVLRRAGFGVYGEERCYQLKLDGRPGPGRRG